MVLAETEEDVSKIIANGSWNIDPDDILENDSESEGNSSDEADSNEDGNDSGTDTDTRMGDDSSDLEHPAEPSRRKRRKVEDYEPHRLYLQWRGYNTVSGAIQFDPQELNKGYLEFKDDRASKFEGLMRMETTPGELRFQGYRIPGMSGPVTMNWDALSHLASDREKVPKHLW